MRYPAIILLLCLVAACKPKTSAQVVHLQLNTDSTLANAYQQHSFTALQTFFDNWALETPPVTGTQLDSMPVAVQHVYAIFKTFYRPHEIDRMGGSEWGNSLYKNTRYFILQNKIYYTADGKEDSILRFHPQLQIPRCAR